MGTEGILESVAEPDAGVDVDGDPADVLGSSRDADAPVRAELERGGAAVPDGLPEERSAGQDIGDGGEQVHAAGGGGREGPAAGKERDTESGLDYFGARYFESGMGRFMSPDWSAKADPIPYAKLPDPQSLNLYAYVGNHPLRSVDLDGHQTILDDEFAAQAAGAGIQVPQSKAPAQAAPPAQQQQAQEQSTNNPGVVQPFSVDIGALWRSGHFESKVGGGLGLDFDMASVATLSLEASSTRTFGTTDGTTFDSSADAAAGLFGLKAEAQAGYRYDPVYSRWSEYHSLDNRLSLAIGAYAGVGGGIKFEFGTEELKTVLHDIGRFADSFIPDWVKVPARN